MKNSLLKSSFLCFCTVLFSVLHTGCGLSIYEDWQASGTKALTGGGAVAGKDYVNGLLPSADSRKYFSKISMNDNGPIEKVSRTDDNPGKSGVRFVKNGGIVIPPGVTISYVNKGHCLDPHLPAPYANEEYQFIPASRLIPEDLQGIYKKLIRKAAAGDENIQRNMQHLVWALRTAGTDAAFANNLTAGQKQILNRCSEYSGQFEEYNTRSKQNSKRLKELLSKVDSRLNVKIGNVTYKASDLLDPEVGKKKINEHLNQLLRISKTLPVEHSGFNYGELQKGIYTDIRGAGFLRYKARIANSTNKEFIFYPTDYAGQVGSGTKSQGLTFFATANTSQRQRVTGGNPDKVEVDDQREPEKKEEECICSMLNKRKREIHKKHAWRYDTVVACRYIQFAAFLIPGVSFFYKALHGDYDNYSDAAKDAALLGIGKYLKALKSIDFCDGFPVGSVAGSIDLFIDSKGKINDTSGMVKDIKNDFAKIDRIIQNEIARLPSCPVHSK